MTLANGLVISKICYSFGVTVRTTCSTHWNRAARSVKGLSRFTSTRTLFESCSWLTVKQLAVFKSKQLVHKTLLSKKPSYLHSRFFSDNTFTARQHSTTGCIMLNQAFRCKSFRHRGAYKYMLCQQISGLARPADIQIQVKEVDQNEHQIRRSDNPCISYCYYLKLV